jgi:hypothetical protein
MSAPDDNIRYRLEKLENRMETISARVHGLANTTGENQLNIAFLQRDLAKAADKDDVERLEGGLGELRSMVFKASVAVTGSTLSLAIALAVNLLSR